MQQGTFLPSTFSGFSVQTLRDHQCVPEPHDPAQQPQWTHLTCGWTRVLRGAAATSIARQKPRNLVPGAKRSWQRGSWLAPRVRFSTVCVGCTRRRYCSSSGSYFLTYRVFNLHCAHTSPPRSWKGGTQFHLPTCASRKCSRQSSRTYFPAAPALYRYNPIRRPYIRDDLRAMIRMM
jgi:hypothetical protein